MAEYIKQYVQLYLTLQDGNRIGDDWPIKSHAACLLEVSEELQALDARDFEPVVQMELLRIRGNLRSLSVTSVASIDRSIAAEFKKLLPVLDAYRGPGSGGITRHVPYMHDTDLRTIVERDYVELRVRAYPSGAWKSTVILAGSILEAILFDVLSDPKRHATTMASSMCPTNKSGPKIDVLTGDWKLEKLIDVAVDTGILPKPRADSIDQVLRDYRNFVHPKKEIRSAHPCREAEAMMSVGILDGVCNHFDETLK
jgi:hypothetical protein